MNNYRKYLLLDWLWKKLETAGVETRNIDVRLGSAQATAVELKLDGEEYAWPSPASSSAFDVSLTLIPDWGLSDRAQAAEDNANLLVEAIPGSRVWRDGGYITIWGDAPGALGGRWSIYLGEGVCERVVVGTRTVMKPAPDAPMIEVEEPIYEVRCVDPIREGVMA